MILQEHHKEFAIIAFTQCMPCKQAVNTFVREFPHDLLNPSQPENTNIKRNLRDRKTIEIKTKYKFCWITLNLTKIAQTEMQNIYMNQLAIMQRINTTKDIYQDTKYQNSKTYRFQKMCMKTTNKPRQ